MSFFSAFTQNTRNKPTVQKVIRPVKDRVQGNHSPVTKHAAPTKQSPKPNKKSPCAGQSCESTRLLPREPRNGCKRSPSCPAFGDDSEGDSDHEPALSQSRKRKRVEHGSVIDNNRRIRDMKNWSEDVEGCFAFKHAADLTRSGKPGDFGRIFKEDLETTTEVSLSYPSASQPERFQLVAPREWDGYKPAEDISETIKRVLSHYLPPSDNQNLLDESQGIPFRLTRALNRQNHIDYIGAISDYNSAIKTARSEGGIARKLDKMHTLPLPLVERILNQIYVRTVSPQVDKLRAYEGFSDNTYGELLPPFSSQIFRDTRLDSSSVFLDLGSGVGNVVLQAALETGCESHGIEVMENPCDLARAQAQEFPARCRLWGLHAGSVSLLKGSFLEDDRVSGILKRADVVLINNQAFNPTLNDTLTSLFLDMKEGARIVTLKSFVPAGWRLTERTRDSIIGVLDVKRKEYWSGCVSWKPVGGEYFVATKDSSRIERILAASRDDGGRARRQRLI